MTVSLDPDLLSVDCGIVATKGDVPQVEGDVGADRERNQDLEKQKRSSKNQVVTKSASIGGRMKRRKSPKV